MGTYAMSLWRRARRGGAAALAAAILSACGGGSGGSAPTSGPATVTTPAPTVTLTLNTSSIVVGKTATLTWTTTNATACTATETAPSGGSFTGQMPTSGTYSVAPAAGGTYSYTLQCAGSDGQASATATLVVTAPPPPPPAPTVTIAVNPTSIVAGQTATLTWSAANASACTASETQNGGSFSGQVASSGMLPVAPAAAGTYSYTLQCTGSGGQASATATLAVTAPPPAPTVTIAVSPTSIIVGQTATLTWSTTNASACTASETANGGSFTGQMPTSGTYSVAPAAPGTYSYTLQCTASGGQASATATLVVAAPPPPPPAPTVTVGVNPNSITAGQSATLTWSSTNATACTASQSPAGPFSGAIATSGTLTVNPASAGPDTYQVSCSGSGGTASASATVTVNAPPPPPTLTVSASPTSITVGQSATVTWTSSNATSCTASESSANGGFTTGSVATSGSQSVTPLAAGTYTYTIACTGSGGTSQAAAGLTVSSTSAANTVPVIVDSGPAGAPGAFNVPFVSVTVCAPGTTTCQTIDHVLVDTGSYGLRILASPLGALALPPVTGTDAAPMAECAQFVSGFTWGSVRTADVQLAGETASSIPIQIIGDTGSAYANIPTDCSSAGANLSNLASLGSNGILGVGLTTQDCGAACVSQIVPGTYYVCNAGSCTGSTATLTQQVSNPVSSFAADNDGAVLQMPAVGPSGGTNVAGTLIFGIGTRSNNALGSAQVFTSDSSFNFTTTFQGTADVASFIDSGSNGLFFADNSLPSCRNAIGFYCPAAPTTLSATNTGLNAATGTLTFTIVSADGLFAAGVTAGPVGGTAVSLGPGQGSFDWGLPFFFGRPVFVAIEGKSTPGGTGPYWAY